MYRSVKLEQNLPNDAYTSCHQSQMRTDFGPSSIDANHRQSIDMNQIQRPNQSTSAEKICRVCGDKALSINFNVITCESCKAFFRRNALKPKEFRCPFDGSCDITTASRKFCKKCRLRKCFEVGMMKEWIMSEEARIQKRQLIEQNREKRRHVFVFNTTTPTKIRKTDSLDSPPTSSISSLDDRQLETPTYFNGVPGPPPPTSAASNDWIVQKKFSAISDCNRSSVNSEAINADSISIPKSVLLILINRCQQNIKNACPRCPPPPVLMRALRLYENGGLDDMEWLEDATTNGQSLKCICSCACGARPPSVGVGIAQSAGDVSSISSIISMDEEGRENLTPASGDAKAVTNAFRQIDYNRQMEAISTDRTVDISPSIHALHPPGHDMNAYIQELSTARRALDGLADELGFNPGQNNGRYVITELSDIIRTTHGYVNRIIEMSKRLSTFRNLTTADQMVLLQNGMSEQVQIQSTINYNHDMDAWTPFGRDQPYLMNMEMFNHFRNVDQDQHHTFVQSFAPQWSSDEILMQNMAAICLFDPARAGLVDTERVQQQRTLYYGFMKNYLLAMYGQREGQNIFNEINNRLNWLRHGVSRMQPTYHLELSPQNLSPLMLEFL